MRELLKNRKARALGLLASLAVLILVIVTAVNDRADADPWHDMPKYQWFVAQYEARHGDVSASKAYELVDNAIQMCHFLDGNPSLPNAYAAGVSSGMSSDQAVSIIELGVQVYCPEHSGLWTEG